MADSGIEGGASGAGQKALVLVSQARGRFVAMPAKRRNSLLAGAGAVLAIVLGMMWYAGRPDWRTLFSGLEGKDVQQVSQELAAAGIPFQMTADGTGVQVPADALDKARMEVASKGMPQTGRLGFELFDKPNWVGSEFDERVNYQRALEGELEHTVATLGVVRSARVHLVLPQPSLFTSGEKVAKASVVLKLKRSNLDPEQTEAIRNLVAGAVENLSPEQVTLVDADGRVNLQARGRSAAEGDETRQMEAKLVAMLEPLAGAGNVRATVNVSYDQGTEERTDEVYDPAQTATLSVQKSEQSSGVPRAASGVPGTASNSPAAAPAGAVQGSARAAAPGTPPLLQQKEALPVFPQNTAGQAQTVKEESGTYAVSKHLIHTEVGPGRVRRLTAAVVVNDRMVVEGFGKAEKTVWRPRTTDEMHRLEGLAKGAVGFDEQRGDQVVMENVSFSSNAPELQTVGVTRVFDEAKGLMQTQPALLKTAGMSLIGLMLVWFVLRPVAAQLVATLKEPMLLTAGVGAADQHSTIGSLQANEPTNPHMNMREQQDHAAQQLILKAQRQSDRLGVFEQISDHIKREPVQSTRLIEAWIASDREVE